MTARQVWEGMLTELSKANAPSLLLHEFNYYFNKAINQYINKRYNIYDINQLTTDDLRVLKATAILTPTEKTTSDRIYGDLATIGAGASKLFGATYEVILPDDYLHMLNCVCIYKMNKTHQCYDKDDYVDFAAKRLTADSWSTIINDYYNRPLPERPYYYIHNVNASDTVPTNPYAEGRGTDITEKYKVYPDSEYIIEYLTGSKDEKGNISWNTVTKNPEDEFTIEDFNTLTDKYKRVTKYATADGKTSSSNFPRTILLGSPDNRVVSTVEKEAGTRYGNTSKVRCEIRYGRDNSVFQLTKVFIDYIKAPQVIRLTKELVDLTEDTSQIMEFPDYVCQEIINELTALIMARDADPRFNIQSAVTQSIANPAQQLTPQQAATRQATAAQS